MRHHQLDEALAACLSHRDPGRVMKAGNVEKQFRHRFTISSKRCHAFCEIVDIETLVVLRYRQQFGTMVVETLQGRHVGRRCHDHPVTKLS